MQADIKLSTSGISKTVQSGGFLGSLLSKLADSLMKVAVHSAIDAGIQKKKKKEKDKTKRKQHGSGTTTLMISNKKINNKMKIVQAFEDSNILLKEITEKIKNETKEPKWGFLSILLGTLVASLLGNILGGGSGIKKGKRILRASCGNKMNYHPLKTLKYTSIIRMNQDLMVLILEIICLIK